jgi:hypothetical protein
MTPEEQQWHWGEGNKYAIEGMKSLLLLNGGSAVALLTFYGNKVHQSSATVENLGEALICFALGTLFSAGVFVAAYLTQLHYGNVGTTTPDNSWHKATYLLFGLGLLGFIGGIFLRGDPC